MASELSHLNQASVPLERVHVQGIVTLAEFGPYLVIQDTPNDGQSFGPRPFDALSSEGLPLAPERSLGDTGPGTEAKPKRKHRGRVDILRQTAGRGGKTVTVVKGFIGIGLPEKEQLAKAMQKACGTGGTVKNGQIEIQGDKRAEVARILTEADFHPVFAGG